MRIERKKYNDVTSFGHRVIGYLLTGQLEQSIIKLEEKPETSKTRIETNYKASNVHHKLDEPTIQKIGEEGEGFVSTKTIYNFIWLDD